jgi:hypothetical protein
MPGGQSTSSYQDSARARLRARAPGSGSLGASNSEESP